MSRAEVSHRPRVAGEPAPRGGDHEETGRSLTESRHELAAALTGRRGSPAPPSWLPAWLPEGVRRFVGVVMQRVNALLAWWKQTRIARAQARFNLAQGGLLCGGLAYTALFALFAALAIGYTIFMSVLGGDEKLRDSLFDQIDTYLPGLIDTGDGGAIKPDQLLLTGLTSITGVIAALALLWTALSFMSALRGAERAMYGLQKEPVNFVLGKLSDLGGFVVLLVGVVASAASGIFATQASAWLTRRLDLPDGARTLFTLGGLLVAFLIDMGIVIYVIRFLAHADPSRSDLLRGAAVAALALGVLRVLGTAVVAGSASKNVLLASFAALVTVLLLVNFVTRVLLLVTAWVANPSAESVYGTDDEEEATPRTLARAASSSADDGAATRAPSRGRATPATTADEVGAQAAPRRRAWWRRLLGR